jgi:hypothetical protein
MFHVTHYTRSYFYTMYTLFVLYGTLLMGDYAWTLCLCDSYSLFPRFGHFDVRIPMLFCWTCGGHVLGGRAGGRFILRIA